MIADRYTLRLATALVATLASTAPPAQAAPKPKEDKAGDAQLPSIMHVDPLDENRASAMHRGRNPHARLTPDQHIKVALKHFTEGRAPQALGALAQALRQYPKSAELYNVRASIELNDDDTSSALSDIEQAVKLNPENPLYHVARAQIYLKFERQAEAMADLNKAVELNPDLVPARFNRGALLAYQGKNRQALADFDHCIAIDPHLPAPYFNRGSLYHALGETQKARNDLRRFIQIAPAESWKQSARDLLKAWDSIEPGHAADNPQTDNKP